MDLDEDRAKDIKNALVAHRDNEYPPRPLIEAVAHLIGEATIASALGTRDGAGRWHCLLVTDSHIVHVQAVREGDTWYSLDSHRQDSTELVARMWSRSQVVRLEVGQCREFGAWRSEATFRAVLSDGETLQLPPDGQYPHSSAEDLLEKLVQDFRLSLSM